MLHICSKYVVTKARPCRRGNAGSGTSTARCNRRGSSACTPWTLASPRWTRMARGRWGTLRRRAPRCRRPRRRAPASPAPAPPSSHAAQPIRLGAARLLRRPRKRRRWRPRTARSRDPRWAYCCWRGRRSLPAPWPGTTLLQLLWGTGDDDDIWSMQASLWVKMEVLWEEAWDSKALPKWKWNDGESVTFEWFPPANVPPSDLKMSSTAPTQISPCIYFLY